jgi:hypothetical protein
VEDHTLNEVGENAKSGTCGNVAYTHNESLGGMGVFGLQPLLLVPCGDLRFSAMPFNANYVVEAGLISVFTSRRLAPEHLWAAVE